MNEILTQSKKDLINLLNSKNFNSKLECLEHLILIGYNLDKAYDLLTKIKVIKNEPFNNDGFIINKVKTFEHVCILLNINIDKFYKKFKELPTSELALKKLILIAKLINQDWKVNLKDKTQYNYYPWFELDENNGCVFYYSNYNCWAVDSAGSYGGCLYVKNQKLSDHFGKMFIDIWKEYLLNNENIYDFMGEIKN